MINVLFMHSLILFLFVEFIPHYMRVNKVHSDKNSVQVTDMD